MTSPYFEDLAERYGSELDDLRSDSEGKDVLKKRLRDKRQALKALMPMLADAPEMVTPAFHGAFGFNDRKILGRAAESFPGMGGFPAWEDLARTLTIAPWALPFIDMCLEETDGDVFLVTSAVLEWLQTEDIRRPESASTADDAIEDHEDDDAEDLSDAGAGWMTDQGFDTVDR